MRIRTFLVILAFLVASGISVNEASASAASYSIDEVYDNVNGDWFAGTPTLTQGESYDLTIVGSGESGSIFGEYAELFVSEGAFINYGGSSTDWSIFSDPPVISESVIGDPIFSLNHTYTVTGNFVVPNSAPTGPGEALIWLDSSYLNPPEDGSDLFGQYCYTKWGREHCFDSEPLAYEVFDINVNPVVPEPATLALLSMGLMGAGLRNRKRK